MKNDTLLQRKKRVVWWLRRPKTSPFFSPYLAPGYFQEEPRNSQNENRPTLFDPNNRGWRNTSIIRRQHVEDNSSLACQYSPVTMEGKHTVNGEQVQLCEYIKDRLYFVTLTSRKEPKSTAEVHYFSIDDELVYINYYSDFGPLNLAMLYRYCAKVNTKLKCLSNGKKKVVHYTTNNPQKRINAAYLIASYAIIYLKMVPREAFRPLLTEKGHAFRAFQDASIGASAYQIRLMDVLDGVYRALQCGFFNFNDFDLTEYEYYDNIEHGDLNWVLPSKFLAFCGPSSEHLTVYKPPEFYLPYFKRNCVSTVIRLNKKAYDARIFTDAGIEHFDLYFMDGGVPSQPIAEKFLKIAEAAKGAVAVHCKAGLGRTGSLIGAYLMKHYRMTAQEAIAWLRICRPGSVIGRQQTWLEDMEYWLWKCGEAYRIQHHGDGDKIPRHAFGIYSIKAKLIATRKPITNGSDIILPKGVGFLKYLLEEETQDKEESAAFYAGIQSEIKPMCKKNKLNRRREVKVPYPQCTPRADMKTQSLYVTNCPSKKFSSDKHEETPPSNKRLVQSTKREKKGLPIYNKRERETKEIKESKEELTQGDHLNMIKTLMRSRVSRQLVPKARNEATYRRQ